MFGNDLEMFGVVCHMEMFGLLLFSNDQPLNKNRFTAIGVFLNKKKHKSCSFYSKNKENNIYIHMCVKVIITRFKILY